MINLYDYQNKAVDRMEEIHNSELHYKGFGLFFEMGLGKTITTLEFIKRVKPTNILIICPKSLKDMWRWEFFKHIGSEYVFSQNSEQKQVFIENYESLDKLTNRKWDLIVLDECQKVKNYKTIAWKNINSLIRSFTLCLSGTPITNTFTDIYSIIELISPTILNMTPTMFERKYIKDGSLSRTEELYSKLSRYTSFAKLTDHIEMPNSEDIIIPTQLDNDLRDLYDLVIRRREPLTGLQIIRKLSDICLCSVKTPKLKACDELVKDILAKDEKVIIFTTLQKNFDDLVTRYECLGICGATKDRQEIVNKFTTDENEKILICNIKVGGTGLNLQVSNNVIYWGHDYELGSLEQSKGRIYRIGQDKPCKYYHLQYMYTIDQQIYQCLLNKKNVIEELLKLYGEK